MFFTKLRGCCTILVYSMYRAVMFIGLIFGDLINFFAVVGEDENVCEVHVTDANMPATVLSQQGSTEIDGKLKIPECKAFKDGDYCHRTMLDLNGHAEMMLHPRCICPNGYICPRDPRHTKLSEPCIWILSETGIKRQCNMICIPNVDILFRS